MENTTSTYVVENSDLDSSLNGFEPISLDEMNSVELLNRAEMKYLLNKKILLELLGDLAKNYKILEIGGVRKAKYHTVYFDTPNFEMYYKHHNWLLNRYKIRMRKYADSNLSFMEIKFKDNKKKTIKKRIPLLETFGDFNKESEAFVSEKSPFLSKDLSLVLWNYYVRITLVSKNNIERLTIDMDLEFYDGSKERYLSFPNLVIVEVKQEGFSQKSDFVKLMHQKSIHPMGFSKYCIGLCSIYNGIKSNNFKEKLLAVSKLNGGLK